ncbi:unnamed protein product [Fraxinus pennsylvanica]|uniref:Uncharacterized protein n=1 Tax=Fraxinus pennsylvanica TaxID=56036 RepID=A0AAD1YYC3_9LAMI|nr:unnamed protein product [Fraxinus pennsylvanica]
MWNFVLDEATCTGHEPWNHGIRLDHNMATADPTKPYPYRTLVSSAPQSKTLSGHHTKYYILQEILESGNIAETDVLGSVMKHMRNKIDGERSTTALKNWLIKMLRIDGHNAALCHTTWPTTLDCLGGNYYIT